MKKIFFLSFIFLVFIVLLSCYSSTRRLQVYHDYKSFDEPSLTINEDNFIGLSRRLQDSLGEEWFVIPNDRGFDVYYGKLCQEKFIKNLEDTTDGAPDKISRIDFFKLHGADSVNYYSGVSIFIDFKIDSFFFIEENGDTSWYKTTPSVQDIYEEKFEYIKFEIYFEPKWSKAKYKYVLSRNNKLKRAILKTPLFKSNLDFFSDYRFWVPSISNNYWKDRVTAFDYTFERLPYTSEIYNNSIFIVSDKTYFFDRIGGLKGQVIELKREKVLKSIALAFGVKDYYLVN